MRRWMMVLAVTLLPLAGAQATELGSDGSGDVTSNGGLPTPGSLDEIDLQSLAAAEDARGFTFTVTVAELPEQMAPGVILAAYEVGLRHGDQIFQVDISRSNLIGTTDFFARLLAYDAGRDVFVYVQDVEVTPRFTDDGFSVFLPRESLRDQSGAVPAPGRVLDRFYVNSFADQVLNPGALPVEQADGLYWEDHMPDDGVLDAVLDVTFGVRSTGHLLLASEEPFRASNGEATTFVFTLEAENRGSEADRVRFDATGFPSGWDVTLPPDIKLPAGGTKEVAVVVRTAFAHAHGSTQSFVLSMTSSNDPAAVGRIEIGVHYPEIPQPAGHHDRLWIHSHDHSDDPVLLVLGTALGTAFSQTGVLQDVYMNAIEEDDRADETPSEARKCQIIALDPDYPVGTGYCWDLPLDPGLQLGLDFDLARLGEITVSVGSLLPLPGVSLEGELIHYSAPDTVEGSIFTTRVATTLAVINRTPMQDMLTGGDLAITAPVVPLAEADLIPYERDASLLLRLQLNTLRPDTWIYGPPLPPPVLYAGGEIRLPLNEYADPVEDIVDLGAKGVRLVPVSEQERFVNPGKTVVFQAVVANHGNETDITLDLIGSNREWATILGSPQLHLAQHEELEIAIRVQAPKDAQHEATADLVLQASSLDDVADRSLIRFVARVDAESDWPDEADLANRLEGVEGKDAPGASLAFLAMAVGLAGVLRRKPDH